MRFPGRRWTDRGVDEADASTSSSFGRSDSTSSSGHSDCGDPFRARASTDSRLPPRPARARNPTNLAFPMPNRRMSFSMKGNNNTGTY